MKQKHLATTQQLIAFVYCLAVSHIIIIIIIIIIIRSTDKLIEHCTGISGNKTNFWNLHFTMFLFQFPLIILPVIHVYFF
jgi:hypothetical protein